MTSGRFDEALDYFRKAVAIYPKFAGAHINIGMILLRQGQIADAAKAFEQPTIDFPANASFRYQLGSFYEAVNQRSNAIDQYMRVLTLKDVTADMALHIGRYISKSPVDGCAPAMPSFRLAVRLGPQSAETHNALGLCLARTGQTVEALQEFQTAVRLDPDNSDAITNLASVTAGIDPPDR